MKQDTLLGVSSNTRLSDLEKTFFDRPVRGEYPNVVCLIARPTRNKIIAERQARDFVAKLKAERQARMNQYRVDETDKEYDSIIEQLTPKEVIIPLRKGTQYTIDNRSSQRVLTVR